MTRIDLLAELGQRGAVRFGLDLRIGDLVRAISNLGGATIAVIYLIRGGLLLWQGA